MKILSLIITLLLSWPSLADIYIVVNEQSQIEQISQEQIAALYLGRKRTMESQKIIILERGDQERSVFFNRIINMSLSQVNAYWAKLRFSGRVRMPEQVATDDELFARLKRNSAMLGYSMRPPTIAGVKVILTIKDDEK